MHDNSKECSNSMVLEDKRTALDRILDRILNHLPGLSGFLLDRLAKMPNNLVELLTGFTLEEIQKLRAQDEQAQAKPQPETRSKSSIEPWDAQNPSTPL